MTFHCRGAPGPPADSYGLLVAAATVSTERTARLVCALLQSKGIRSTAGLADPAAGWRVLVFPEDWIPAFEILRSLPD
ncbi:hypothetical protein [Nocardia sp. NBC_00511]|uniref:hypothetical protein n=1 Tax=Nocardia sp. NBC_00511 TaxID=2903591 RepID=UPI0030E0A675